MAQIQTAAAVDASWLLSKGTDIISGGAGMDTFLARAGFLGLTDRIDGGVGLDNTIVCVGGGAFNLSLPAVLTNINVVTAVEGIGVAVPSITLRAGLDSNVVRTSSPLGANAMALIVGAANHAVITLGAGSDTVYLGAGETVIGGTGNCTFHIDAASAGDIITGGSGNNTMVVDGGGAVALGAGISGIATVRLSVATNLGLNGMGFVSAVGSAGADTITAGGANQTLTGGAGADVLVGSVAGGDVFADTAAGIGGDVIRGFLASDRIDVTDIGFAGAKLKVGKVGADTKVTLTGAGGSTSFVLAGRFGAHGFAMADDGHGGVFISHS